MAEIPSLKGKQLYRLLISDGWEVRRNSAHGMWLRKKFPEGYRYTTVKNTGHDLPRGTLNAILGPRETGLGREGLLALIEKYGLR